MYQPRNTIPVSTPSPNDVLCGRGRISFEHEGNKRFRFLIASNLLAYTEARTKKQKMDLVRSIAQTVFRSGGRFLKRDRETNLWYDVGIKGAKTKVGHSLRDAANDKIKCVRAMSRDIQGMRDIAKMQQESGTSGTSGTSELVPSIPTENDENPSLHESTLQQQSLETPQQACVQPVNLPQDDNPENSAELNYFSDATPSSSSAYDSGSDVEWSESSTDFDVPEATSLPENSLAHSWLAHLNNQAPSSVALKASDVGVVSNTQKDDDIVHSPTLCSVSQEVLNVFNDINLSDLDEYCIRQEKALLSSLSRNLSTTQSGTKKNQA